MKLVPARLLLKLLLALDSYLHELISLTAIFYEGGIHPKHRLTKYHDFFVRNIKSGESVLDVGCGTGEVAYDIARKANVNKVVGIDINKRYIDMAKARYQRKARNLVFINGRAPKDAPRQDFDVIVLSNVLEHIKDRVAFLAELLEMTHAKRVLIRVPLFEKDWSIPLRKELGLNYFSDPTHYIEHTQEDFFSEMEAAQLNVHKYVVKWGEMWAVCVPKGPASKIFGSYRQDVVRNGQTLS